MSGHRVCKSIIRRLVTRSGSIRLNQRLNRRFETVPVARDSETVTVETGVTASVAPSEATESQGTTTVTVYPSMTV